jgi:hypothetical protein
LILRLSCSSQYLAWNDLRFLAWNDLPWKAWNDLLSLVWNDLLSRVWNYWHCRFLLRHHDHPSATDCPP